MTAALVPLAEPTPSAEALEAAKSLQYATATAPSRYEIAAALDRFTERVCEQRVAAAVAGHRKVIGNLQTLIVNATYWVEHGGSETASKAMNEAQNDGWEKVGWSALLATERPAPVTIQRYETRGDVTLDLETGEVLPTAERPAPRIKCAIYSQVPPYRTKCEPCLAAGRCVVGDRPAPEEQPTQETEQPGCGTKLWLWNNGDHFLAYACEYPTYGGGDPMTLGEPAAWAIFKESSPPSTGPHASHPPAVVDYTERATRLGDILVRAKERQAAMTDAPVPLAEQMKQVEAVLRYLENWAAPKRELDAMRAVLATLQQQEHAMAALRNVEADLNMLRVAINSVDPYRQLLVRVGDMERVVKAALDAANAAGDAGNGETER